MSLCQYRRHLFCCKRRLLELSQRTKAMNFFERGKFRNDNVGRGPTTPPFVLVETRCARCGGAIQPNIQFEADNDSNDTFLVRYRKPTGVVSTFGITCIRTASDQKDALEPYRCLPLFHSNQRLPRSLHKYCGLESRGFCQDRLDKEMEQGVRENAAYIASGGTERRGSVSSNAEDGVCCGGS